MRDLNSSEQKYVYKDLAKHFPALYFSKELDSYAPIVYGNSDESIRRFEKGKIILDKWFEKNMVFFVEKTQRIIGWEVDTAGFNIYNKFGKLDKAIKLEEEKHLEYTKTICLAYSNLENRIGAVNNDHTLSFWDVQDDYKFEKIIHSENSNLEDQIFYINHIGTWLTIDQKSNLFLWDIEEELPEKLPQKHKGTVQSLEEIIHQRIIVFSTLKKQLVFWNLIMKVCIKIINLDSVSIHSMCFVPDYKLLATANFGNTVMLWRFIDQDISKCGELVGHTSQVAAIDYLLDSPVIITWDDSGIIKTWDIRSGNCFQTSIPESRIIIRKFLNLDENNFMAIAKRCHWFNYEESNVQRKICKMLFEYNPETNELYVGTKINIRCIDLHTGKTNRVLANIVEDGVEITKLKLHFDKTNLLIGNSNGEVKLVSSLDGSFRMRLFSHKKDVSGIEVDAK